jgi:hypothetical protein
MSGLFGHLRSTAGKAAFEAEKVRRIASIQSAIRSLKSDANRAYYEVGRLAFTLYEAGEIEQPALKALCERLRTLESEITAREQEIEQLRREPFLEPTVGAAGQVGVICPNGHGPLVAGAAFCQECGAAGVTSRPLPAPICQQCGAALFPEAQFCASCGTAIDSAARAPIVSPDTTSHVSEHPAAADTA